MTEKSMLDIAFETLTKWENKDPNGKLGLPFADLWKEVVKEKEYTDEDIAKRIGSFYTDLSLDGRFVTLTDNTWDLRSRHPYDTVHIDVQDVYSDVDETDEDDEEEKEYDASVEGKPLPDEEEEEEGKGGDDDAAALVGIKKDNTSY